MGLREELEGIVKGPYSSPAEAERAARAAAALAAYLRVDEDAERIIRGEVATVPQLAGDRFDSLTLHAAAALVLVEAGVPLHVKELGVRIKARGWRHRRSKGGPDQINYQLAARLPRHPDIFVRVAPNTFGLVRWGGSRSVGKNVAPHVGTFRGPGGAIASSLGDRSDEVSESPWRSS